MAKIYRRWKLILEENSSSEKNIRHLPEIPSLFSDEVFPDKVFKIYAITNKRWLICHQQRKHMWEITFLWQMNFLRKYFWYFSNPLGMIF